MVYTPTGDTNTNPYGAVTIFDSESPCIFTARAIQTVSGGQFVMTSGTNGASIVGSAASSYVSNDINVCPALLYDNVVGMALYNVASGTNNYVSVARRGSYLVQSTGVVSGGFPVTFNSGGVVNITDASVSGTAVTVFPIGKALTTADSGAYCLLALNL